eukprot:gene15616-15681_t
MRLRSVNGIAVQRLSDCGRFRSAQTLFLGLVPVALFCRAALSADRAEERQCAFRLAREDGHGQAGLGGDHLQARQLVQWALQKE